MKKLMVCFLLIASTGFGQLMVSNGSVNYKFKIDYYSNIQVIPVTISGFTANEIRTINSMKNTDWYQSNYYIGWMIFKALIETGNPRSQFVNRVTIEKIATPAEFPGQVCAIATVYTVDTSDGQTVKPTYCIKMGYVIPSMQSGLIQLLQ